MRRLPGLLILVLLVALEPTARAQALRGRRGAQAPPTQPAPAVETPAPQPATVEPFRSAGDRPIDIQHIRLDLKVDLPGKRIDGRATLKLRSLWPISTISLDAVDFEVTGVTLVDGDKKPMRFSHDGKKLLIDLDPAWPAERTASLIIDYRIREPKTGLHFFGPSPAEPEVPLTVWSHGEPTNNRYWFPCVDQPNQRQSTELIVTVAEGFEVLSNGKLLSRQANAAEKTVTFHWLQDKPHVSYLVSLVVGQFDIVAEEWDKLPVLYYVPKGHKDDIARSFGRTREMLAFFSQRFGIHYPWDKYAQVVVEQFIAGGQENTSATTLTERALHDQRALLDNSPDSLIAHELAHQWWGDLVTCRDWAHIWLNEGFASYAEALWDEHSKGADEYAYTIWSKSGPALGGGKARPVVDHRYPTASSMFDGRAYPKGAWVLHMLRRRLGEPAFWKSIQRYGNEQRLRSSETSDFRKTLERQTGRDLERFFYDWTERPGNPVLDIATEFLSDSKQARVAVKQTQAGEAFHFPLTLVFRCSSSTQPIVVEQEVTDKEHTFFVPLPSRPTLIEVDPDQAVLAEIQENKGRDLWQTQLEGGTTVASRLRAARHFASSKVPMEQEHLATALTHEKFWGVQVEIANALGEAGGTICRDALIQGLQHAHPKVRRACADQLRKFHRDATVAAALKAVLEKGDPSYNVEAAALASYAGLQQPDTVAVLSPWLAKPSHNEVLRNAVLNGLGEGQDLSALETLFAWTKRGKPRACRSAALQGLAKLAQTANPTEAQQRQIALAIMACLENEGPRIRLSAISALRDLGRSASPALVALEALGLHDPEELIRDLAKRAGEQIRNQAPVPVELTRLRDELDRLRREHTALEERLNRYEHVERKGQ
jgi:aminopeptidase N